MKKKTLENIGITFFWIGMLWLWFLLSPHGWQPIVAIILVLFGWLLVHFASKD